MRPPLAVLCAALALASLRCEARKWVGTWTTSPQLVETNNNPPSPGLTGNTLRQVVRISVGGDSLRLRLSNEFSEASTTIEAASIALSTGNGAIATGSSHALTFQGKSSVTLAAKSAVVSDPIKFDASPRADLAITLRLGQASATVTGHPGSRTTSYLLAGDKLADLSFSGAAKTEHWYVINSLDVKASDSAASIAILGNSITDGRGSTTDQQNRWTDILAEALRKNPATAQVGVLNQGIGGNCVLNGGLGPTGVSRFKRDILDQTGVKWVMILEGVNDIGGVTSASAATTMAQNLINAYKQMITDAKTKGYKVYGATIMPFNGNSYYNASSEACRSTVNRWIRTSGAYDAVVDFDLALRSASDSTKLGVGTFQGDGLHPDATGYQKMGQSVDLGLFSQEFTSASPKRHPAGTKATLELEHQGGHLVLQPNHRLIDGSAGKP